MFVKVISDSEICEKFEFSSNLTIFDQTETEFGHQQGKLVKYDSKVIVIGASQFGGRVWSELDLDWNKTASVEVMTPPPLWAQHKMSPVNDLSSLSAFTALSIAKSLFIFGQFLLIK